MDLTASILVPTEQAVEAMRLLVYVAPVALYLLVLGLVNSRATSTLVESRSDFIALTAVFLPVLVLPLPSLVRGGYALPCVLAAAALVLLFIRLLPARAAGWVVYNLSASKAHAVLERSLRALGWEHRWTDRGRVETDQGFAVEIAPLPILRNVSFHVRPLGTASTCEAGLAALRTEIGARLEASPQLPSASGCCLLMLGVAMLMLPLWMMSRHSDAIADAVTRLLLS